MKCLFSPRFWRELIYLLHFFTQEQADRYKVKSQLDETENQGKGQLPQHDDYQAGPVTTAYDSESNQTLQFRKGLGLLSLLILAYKLC